MQRRQLLKGLYALPLFGLFKVAESRATEFITSINPPDTCPVLPEDTRVTQIQIENIEVDDAYNIRKASPPDSLQIIASVPRIETRPIEYSKQLEWVLKQHPTMTTQELAAQLCKSYTWLCDRLSLLKIDEKYHHLVDDGTISLSNAYALA